MEDLKYRIFLSFIFCLGIPLLGFCQGEANNWYFGNQAGLSFNTSPPSVLSDGQLDTSEGCSSISNPNGDLLFYTDGRTIWNANHNIMPNADYFGGSGLFGDPSSTSSGLIVPHPTNTDLYFVFTVDEPHHDNAYAYPNQGPANPDGSPATNYSDVPTHTVPEDDDGFNNGLAYSIVDMTLDGGLGDVVPAEKNIELITYDPTNPEDIKFKCSEKITAVRGEDCNSVWVITHFKDKFYAFLIDDNGVDENPVVSQLGPLVSTNDYRRSAIGYLKASPNGEKLITANQTMDYNPITGDDFGTGNIYLFDFNADTGQVTNPLELINNVNAYGVEFSSDGSKAYASVTQGGQPQIFQWDLNAVNIPDSIFSFANVTGNVSGAIQLAPNGKIYRSMLGQNFLAVINNPDLPGSQANYSESFALGAIDLGFQQATFGLPPFIQSLFAERIDIIGDNEEEDTQKLDLCDGESFTLSHDDINGASYTWYKDGEIVSGENGSTLTISQPPGATLPYQETYTLDLDLNDGSCSSIGVANITYFPFPEANPATLSECVSNINQNTTEFNLFEANTQILTNGNDLSNFIFTYFESSQEAENNENPIEDPANFMNTSLPQNLSVRVENIESGCTSITDLSLNIFDFQIEAFALKRCDDNENGIQSFDLTSIETQENLTASAFYLTENDALNELNPINNPTDFSITEPYQQDIFFTIENGTACKDLGLLSLEVLTLPFAEDHIRYYCAEDFPNPIRISAGIAVEQLNDFQILWLDSQQTSAEIEVNEAGLYEVATTATETGCTNFRTVEVVESSLAEFSLDIEEFAGDQNTVSVLVSAASQGDYEFSLDDANGPYQDSHVFENILPGVHDMYVRDKNGCGTKQKRFGILGLMDYFTPNNDGINDVWRFKGVFNNKQALAFVYIFDRYGKLLKSFRGLDKFWDGNFNNKPMPSQDYWYKIKLEDGSKLSGHFTLKR